VKAPRGPEVEYRRALEKLNARLKEQTQLISDLVVDGARATKVRKVIEDQLAEAQARFDKAADKLAGNVLQKLSVDNRQRVEATIKDALGVDTARIIDGKDVRDKLAAAVAENVDLIKSIPGQHFNLVADAVVNNYLGVSFIEGSLSNRLKKVGSITDDRARLIARDQTAKFVGSLNRIRQENAGIRRYIWRNQKDERVVGNPSGRYPKGNVKHRDHWSREGKIYRWDDPPADGHPGQPIQCRCYPEPVLDFSELNKNAVRI
jgi:SPP1 gp7 family putative phage head morphogenesis protein